MKKVIIILILFIFFLCSCSNNKLSITKQIIPDEFKKNISNYNSYDHQYLHQYYYYYLDYNSMIYALNMVNYPTFYDTETKMKAISVNKTILVNRKFYLEPDYVPNNLTPVKDVKYVKRLNEVMLLDQEALEMYQKMEKVAKQNNVDLLLFSSYRSYEKQLSLWDKNRSINDLYLALPGYSEHQTGLAIDIGTEVSGLTLAFENTKAFKFLKNEAYKFGFILRYPKGKSDITGYAYEPWHFRYVGENIAKIIWQKNLTLEEYFYQYLEL